MLIAAASRRRVWRGVALVSAVLVTSIWMLPAPFGSAWAASAVTSAGLGDDGDSDDGDSDDVGRDDAGDDDAAGHHKALAKAFGASAFDEVVEEVRQRHIAPLLATARPWVAAANGALSTLRVAEEILPATMWRREFGVFPGFAAVTAPLRCGGPPRDDVVMQRKPTARWHVPWRLEVAPLRWGGLRNRDVEVEVLAQFDAPFDEPAFRCVMSTVLERLPVGRHAAAWRNAATWLLRAHDAHSRLLSPQTWDELQDADSHHAELGLRLHRVEAQWRVAKVSADGPAARAKVLVDDWLLAVEGQDAGAMSQSDLAVALDKPAGSRLRLRLRTGEQPPRVATVTVQSVTVADVVVRPMPGGALARQLRRTMLVQIGKFAPGGAERLVALLWPNAKPGPDALIVDLRGNPGGVIPVALQMLGVLVGQADVASAKTRQGEAEVPSDTSLAGHPGLPMVVIIDSGCASACELMAAALRRHGHALIVGGRSFGKATLQDAVALKAAGERLALTIGGFAAGDGVQIQAEGVAPDVTLRQARNGGPREEDQAFAIRWPSRPAPRLAAVALQALRRCAGLSSDDGRGDTGGETRGETRGDTTRDVSDETARDAALIDVAGRLLVCHRASASAAPSSNPAIRR